MGVPASSAAAAFKSLSLLLCIVLNGVLAAEVNLVTNLVLTPEDTFISASWVVENKDWTAQKIVVSYAKEGGETTTCSIAGVESTNTDPCRTTAGQQPVLSSCTAYTVTVTPQDGAGATYGVPASDAACTTGCAGGYLCSVSTTTTAQPMTTTTTLPKTTTTTQPTTTTTQPTTTTTQPTTTTTQPTTTTIHPTTTTTQPTTTTTQPTTTTIQPTTTTIQPTSTTTQPTTTTTQPTTTTTTQNTTTTTTIPTTATTTTTNRPTTTTSTQSKTRTTTQPTATPTTESTIKSSPTSPTTTQPFTTTPSTGPRTVDVVLQSLIGVVSVLIVGLVATFYVNWDVVMKKLGLRGARKMPT